VSFRSHGNKDHVREIAVCEHDEVVDSIFQFKVTRASFQRAIEHVGSLVVALTRTGEVCFVVHREGEYSTVLTSEGFGAVTVVSVNVKDRNPFHPGCIRILRCTNMPVEGGCGLSKSSSKGVH